MTAFSIRNTPLTRGLTFGASALAELFSIGDVLTVALIEGETYADDELGDHSLAIIVPTEKCPCETGQQPARDVSAHPICASCLPGVLELHALLDVVIDTSSRKG